MELRQGWGYDVLPQAGLDPMFVTVKFKPAFPESTEGQVFIKVFFQGADLLPCMSRTEKASPWC